MPTLTSIKASIWQQEKLDSLLLCLDRYSQHIRHLNLGLYQDDDDNLRLQELPPHLQLHSLQIYAAELQLQPGDGFGGVLGPAAAALTQLRLSDCWVLGGAAALAATVPQLTKLEHLSFCFNVFNERQYFPACVLQDMQQLTYLELACCLTGTNGEEDPLALQPMQALTQLVDLRLAIEAYHDYAVTASMLSCASNLTRLKIKGCFDFEGGTLAGKARLQHLQLASCRTATAEQVAQLLSQLQHLQQLTHLCLDDSIQSFADDPPAAGFSALTASSKLQHLDLRNCTLPAAVWQHVFPAGRQLPLLRSLNISWIRQPPDNNAAAGPHGSLLVSCCPSLQCLDIGGLQYSAELLAPLQGLGGLQKLHVQTEPDTDGWEPLELVCQLTGLRELQADWVPDWLLLQLTQLKQLTALTYSGQANSARAGRRASGYFKAQVRMGLALAYCCCMAGLSVPMNAWVVVVLHVHVTCHHAALAKYPSKATPLTVALLNLAGHVSEGD
jgi:hypothetical protein